MYDPWANKAEVEHEYKLTLVDKPQGTYDAIVLAVAHKEFMEFKLDQLKSGKETMVYDIKGIWDKEEVDGRL